MNISQLPILADGRVQYIVKGIRTHEESGGEHTWILVTISILAVVLAVAIHFYVRHRSLLRRSDPRGLFRELCKAHRLNFRQRTLMRSIVRAKKLNDPCALFLDSRLWMIEPAAAPQLCNPKTVRQMRHLQQVLFSDPPKHS